MSVTRPTMSGWSSFWSLTGDMIPYDVLASAAQGWRSPLESQIAKLYNRNEMREQKELILTLLGVAAGSTALSTYKRVGTPVSTSGTTPVPTTTGEMGGQVSIETVTVINRATTAADLTYLISVFDGTMSPGSGSAITYVNDLSGNGANSHSSQLGW